MARKKNTLSPQAETSIVRTYLEGLCEQARPSGRRTTTYLHNRIAAIDVELESASPLDRLLLIQERMDCEADLESRTDDAGRAANEERFLEVAASFSERKGVSYKAWRQAGVPATVLRKAGVSR